jgi:hypothetical protein
MMKIRAIHFVILAFPAFAIAQHLPPAIGTPTTEPVRLERPPEPPPPPRMKSNGSSGWVDAKKPRYITLSDIPRMFPPRD